MYSPAHACFSHRQEQCDTSGEWQVNGADPLMHFAWTESGRSLQTEANLYRQQMQKWTIPTADEDAEGRHPQSPDK